MKKEDLVIGEEYEFGDSKGKYNTYFFYGLYPFECEFKYITAFKRDTDNLTAWKLCEQVDEKNEYTIEQLEELTGIKNLKIKK